MNPERVKKTEEEKEEEYRLSHKNLTKKVFEHFMALSDEPGEFISPQKKKELIEKGRTDPNVVKRLEKNTESKYRINSLSGPLLAADIFLDFYKTQQQIPQEKMMELLQKIETAKKDISDARGLPITDKEVNEVIEIIKEIQPYLQ